MPDILVLGATGYTGRLITRYLHTHPSRSTFSFSIGGRSKSKLSLLVKELHLTGGVEVIEVDVTDDASVERAVRGFKVVINAVGPFWTYGTGVVRACAKNGIHHVDITAETAWVKLIIEQFDALAQTTGSIIVPSCGLDSVPSDMAIHLSFQTLKNAQKGTVDSSTVGLGASHTCSIINGGMSGGTLASLLTAVEDVPRKTLRGALWNPYELSPLKGLTKPSNPLRLLYRLPTSGSLIQHGAFFPLAPHNAAIVHRTWGLLQRQASTASSSSSYGPEFTYDEFCAASGWLSGLLFSLAMKVALFCLLYFPPARWWLKRVGPAVGSGPSEKALEQGSMEITNVTTTASSSSKPQVHVKTIIRGRGDPGYLLTSIMVSESALCLLDTSKLPEMARHGGVLTPMTAFGDVLVERLRANKRFEFESVVVGMSGDEVDGRKTR